ncbi:MAG: hypothetical protein HDT14_09730 [Oscillibacter sp.]|nr:hypothetical protein [Oscillibacter sp.]
MEERRRPIDSFVNSVTIFDDYILITFNYKEGSERVSFDDIKSSDLKLVGRPIKSPVTAMGCGFLPAFFALMIDRAARLIFQRNLADQER